MKISFSTLGCPGWSWEDIVVTAKDLGFNGIEVRGIENEIYVPKAKPFLETNIISTRDRLAKAGLEIPCLTSACFLFLRDNINTYIQEGKDYIDLAGRLGIPFVRVLGDVAPEPRGEIDINYTAENLSYLAKYADEKGVRLLVETNGFFADSNNILRLIDRAGSSNVGVLWDIHHPYRFMHETVAQTYGTLKDLINFVHIKDSAMEDGKVRYKMLGYGDIPVKDALLLLKDVGYNGFVSLEWVKRWCKDIEEPGVVFSHYVNFVRDIID